MSGIDDGAYWFPEIDDLNRGRFVERTPRGVIVEYTSRSGEPVQHEFRVAYEPGDVLVCYWTNGMKFARPCDSLDDAAWAWKMMWETDSGAPCCWVQPPFVFQPPVLFDTVVTHPPA